MPLRGTLRSSIALLSLVALYGLTMQPAQADEPKPKPENTITIQLGEPVPPQKFERSPKFWIADITDRSGNAQPLLVMKERQTAHRYRQRHTRAIAKGGEPAGR